MTKPRCSILISSYNRLNLFRRTLWGISRRPPSLPYEVIVADEGSTDDILGELDKYRSVFPWTLLRLDHEKFTAETGLHKYHNNPSWSNNCAFKASQGDFIFLQGNEVIPWAGCYDDLLTELAKEPQRGSYQLLFSTTYDMPPDQLAELDTYGGNLSQKIVDDCSRWPLQSIHYRSDVTNYISLCPRTLWLAINGYNEQYFGGICAEDSDFVRRARGLEGGCYPAVIKHAISLHQSHGGKTRYYQPQADVISEERFDEGCRINRAIYDQWDGTPNNPQTWPMGEIGISEVITNG